MNRDLYIVLLNNYLISKKENIQNSVAHLIFEYSSDDIPNTVTHLTSGYFFNKQLKKGDISNSVTHLTFGTHFNQSLKHGDIPNSVTHLTFGSHFNQRLKEGDIPNKVTHLTFGSYFNQLIKPEDIPNSVTHLRFGYDFNQPLKEGVIPNSVTHLTFGHNFNQELNYFITDNLIELIIPKYYIISKVKSNKNILIGYLNNDNYCYTYNKYNILIHHNKKIEFDNYISNMDVNKLKGKIIMKELVEKVFHPTRLLNISNQYNIDFIDLIEIYS